MSFLKMLDRIALRFLSLFVKTPPFMEAEVSDVASQVADALETVAAAFCQIAAGMHTDNTSDQRDMAGVFYTDAKQRFADVFRKLDPKKQQELEAYIVKLCKGKR